MISVKCLKVKTGDAILVSVAGKNILIDGGFKGTFKATIAKELNKLEDKKEKIDLLVLTHFDRDHIGGLLTLLNTDRYAYFVDEIWFNRSSALDKFFFDSSLNLSFSESLNFEQSVDVLKVKKPSLTVLDTIHTKTYTDGYQFANDVMIELLSPTPSKLASLAKEYEEEIHDLNLSGAENDSLARFCDLWDNTDLADDSTSNGTSIAFLLVVNESRYAFLGDAHADVIANSLREMGYSERNKVKLEFLKLSHHGSKYNISADLLGLIDCTNYFVCSSARVSKETVAKIIRSQPGKVKILCNYDEPINYFKRLGDYKQELVEFTLGETFNG